MIILLSNKLYTLQYTNQVPCSIKRSKLCFYANIYLNYFYESKIKEIAIVTV